MDSEGEAEAGRKERLGQYVQQIEGEEEKGKSARDMLCYDDGQIDDIQGRNE